jgi:hypothetical protein
LLSLFNIATTIFMVDNRIYLLSREFISLNSPLLWDTLRYFFVILKNMFFYVWTYRVIVWIYHNAGQTLGTQVDMDSGVVDTATKAVPTFIIFFVIMNFIGLVAMGIVSFKAPSDLPAIGKVQWFFDSNFNSTFDFVVKIIPFKGIAHFFIFSFGKMIMVTSGSYHAVNQTISNST